MITGEVEAVDRKQKIRDRYKGVDISELEAQIGSHSRQNHRGFGNKFCDSACGSIYPCFHG